MAFLSHNSSDTPGHASIMNVLWMRAMRLTNKVLGHRYVKARWRSPLRKLYGRYGDLIKEYEAPSPEYYTTFWMMSLYSDNLHWSGITPILTLLLILILLQNSTFHLIARGFQRTFATDAACQQDAYSSRHLVLSHFGTCMCYNVETNLSWTCLLSGHLSFERPSVLLFCFILKKSDECHNMYPKSSKTSLLMLFSQVGNENG